MSSRNESLDILRLVAILLVLGFHAPHYALWSRAGWIGVDLFFVLSGFLVSGLLFSEFQKHGSISFRRFVLRRGFKIWPSFYVLLAATAAGSALFNRSAFSAGGFIVNALFLQNYFFQFSPWHVGLLGHTWSLAVEEHFYLLLPILLVGFLKLNHKTKRQDPFSSIPLLFVAICALCLLFRLFQLPAGIYRIVAPTHMRMDSLFAGVVVSYLYHFKRQWFARIGSPWALGVTVLAVTPCLFLDSTSPFIQTFGLLFLLLGFSFLVAWAVPRDPKRIIGRRVSAAAAGIGAYSYSIYLWHWIPSLLVGPHPSAWVFWFYMSSTVVLGFVMSECVEKPALRMRERFLPRRGQVALLPAARASRSALIAG